MNTIKVKEKELKMNYKEEINKKVYQSMREKDIQHINPRRGEIWTVDLGQTVGSEIQGVRPCVVIQNSCFNKTSPLIMVYPINMPTKNNIFSNQIQIDPLFIESCEKGIDGFIITEQPLTKSKGCFGRKIGKLYDQVVDFCLEQQLFMCGYQKPSLSLEDLKQQLLEEKQSKQVKEDVKDTSEELTKEKIKKKKKVNKHNKSKKAKKRKSKK